MSIGVDPNARIGYFNASRSGSMLPICLATRAGSSTDEPVGIGLTNPSGAKLHVNGNLKLNSSRSIVGWMSAIAGGGATQGTISFGVTFPSVPVVIAHTAGDGASNRIINIQVSSVTTTGFNYCKTYLESTYGGTFPAATFWWCAVLLLSLIHISEPTRPY